MQHHASTLLPARQPPLQNISVVQWAQHNLWGTPVSAVTTVLLALILLWSIPSLFEWSVFNAVFTADADQCQAARDMGACWGVVAEKYRLILFGRYPFDAQWRPLLATLALTCLLVGSCRPACWNRYLAVAWILAWLLFFVLIKSYMQRVRLL